MNLLIMWTAKWAKSKCTQDWHKLSTKLRPLPDSAKFCSLSAKVKICTISKAPHIHVVRRHTKQVKTLRMDLS